MAAKSLTVVISQSQGKNPSKRQLEEELAAALMLEPSIDVSLVPHLYDLKADHSGSLFLKSIRGHLLVLAWMYPRAGRWTLDRLGVRGQAGLSELEELEEDEPEVPEEPGGIGSVDAPDRNIYCLDLGQESDPAIFLDEIHRISEELVVETVDLMEWIEGSPQQEQLERYLHPERILAGGDGNGNGAAEPTRRRWYPVIDYDRCTNCMECIDFCLFGVYGVDSLERILVEEQDNCKKGCPACSRVCPENAIVFPGHKEPAIAGALGDVGALKIDLSKLFGGVSSLDLAVRERDVELVRDGRDAVGVSTGMPKRQADRDPDKRDQFDDLFDDLDTLSP